jgi:predicted RNase H-like nuclease
MTCVGLDGYRKGWVAVRVDGETRELRFYSTIAELLATKFDFAAIDMPIGLPDRGVRACDLEARQLLKPHASRVFTGARRGLWEFPSHAAANRALWARGEAGISIELWHLGTKICELDRAMTPRRQNKIRETHPELVFLRLNGGQPVPSKHTEEGLRLRRRLLRGQGFRELDRWLKVDRIGSGAKRDDILDACALAVAARDFHLGNVLPRGRAAKDARGLKMQIWY